MRHAVHIDKIENKNSRIELTSNVPYRSYNLDNLHNAWINFKGIWKNIRN